MPKREKPTLRGVNEGSTHWDDCWQRHLECAVALIALHRVEAERAETLLRTSVSHAAVEAAAILRETFEIKPRKKLQGAALRSSRRKA